MAKGRHSAYIFDDTVMELVRKVVEQTPADNTPLLFSPQAGFQFFGIPGALLKAAIDGGRDSKLYTAKSYGLTEQVGGHVFKAWMPQQLNRLKALVEENEAQAAAEAEADTPMTDEETAEHMEEDISIQEAEARADQE